MRAKISCLIFLFAGLLLVSSCDFISDPYVPSNPNLGDTASCLSPSFPPSTPVRKILLEDYTGHTCKNCPDAARELYRIDTTYPGQIIPLAVHAASFAEPVPLADLPDQAPPGSYSYDFRTSSGNAYGDKFKATDLPRGMINRKDYNDTTKTHLKVWWNWATSVNGIIGQAPVADIQIINDFDGASRKLCVHVKTTFLSPMNGTYKLVVLLTQDSIIAWQRDGSVNEQNYIHRHVLRDAINSAWGDVIATGTINTSDSVKMKFAYNIPNSYKGTYALSPDIPVDINHCHVIAFVYDAATYEVLQAEEQAVKE